MVDYCGRLQVSSLISRIFMDHWINPILMAGSGWLPVITGWLWVIPVFSNNDLDTGRAVNPVGMKKERSVWPKTFTGMH